MKIVIGASKPNTFKIGAEAIKWWLNVDYSHVYIRWYLNPQERWIVYHAAHGMVHQIEYNNFLKENIEVESFELDLSDEAFLKLSRKCIDLAAQPYSRIELAQIFLYDLANRFNIKIDTQDYNGYICSELLVDLLVNEFQHKFDKPNYLVTPKDIVEKLKK